MTSASSALGANGSHGGNGRFTFGYLGDYYGQYTEDVHGYGSSGGLGTFAAIPTDWAGMPWQARFKRAYSTNNDSMEAEALSCRTAHAPAVNGHNQGRVCDAAYSPENGLVVLTSRGTAHLAHRKEDGTVVHATLLELLGKPTTKATAGSGG